MYIQWNLLFKTPEKADTCTKWTVSHSLELFPVDICEDRPWKMWTPPYSGIRMVDCCPCEDYECITYLYLRTVNYIYNYIIITV